MQPGNIRYVWAGLSRAQPALLPPPLAGSGSCPAGQSSPGSAGARRQTNRTPLFAFGLLTDPPPGLGLSGLWYDVWSAVVDNTAGVRSWHGTHACARARDYQA